ncbi:unnamed protein product [Prorocentrum cordatum]|uniref:Uncharacterized protein n=1 Tax=Prorocentrum cordatum TaxID=2364126 RepID=A0ABN9Q955_9DINO|nr:unnamed protein product [Polarella glacialis]
MGASISQDARRHLRWLVRIAREERLVNSLELKRGRIAPRRQERVQKSGRFSLELEANLADDSGAEQNADGAVEDTLSFLEVKFPERQGASTRDTGSLKRNLGSQMAVRHAEIHTKSSHDMDLDKARSLLTAPKLSFDWEDRTFEDEAEGGLDVVADITATKGDSKRDLFRDVMRRSVSFRQAKTLSKGTPMRSTSSQSLNAAAEASADEAGATATQPRAPAPAAPTTAPAEAGEPLEEPVAGAGGAAPAHEAEPVAAEAAPRAAEAAQAPGEVAAGAGEAAPAAPAPQEAAPSAAPGAAPAAPAPEEVVPSAGEAAPRGEALPQPAVGGPGGAAGAEPQEAEAAPRAAARPLPAAGSDGDHPRSKWTEVAPAVPVVPRELPAAAGMDFEISPTAPFSPVGVAAVAPPPFEISPTAPLVPQEAPAAGGGDRLEISPTVPFVPQGLPGAGGADQLEISPTAPFVPQGLPGAGGADLFEISPTAPFVPQEALATAIPAAKLAGETQLPTAADGPAAGARGLGRAGRGLKRRASAESAGSEGAASSPGAGGAAPAGPEEGEPEGGPESELDRQRRQKEREWLRHKLKKQREEERLAKRRRAEADRKRRAEEGGLAASMSPEERETFLALHAGAPSAGLAGAPAVQKRQAASGRGGALAGRAAEPLAEDDAGAVLLGGARPAQRPRGFFLAGAAPLAAR